MHPGQRRHPVTGLPVIARGERPLPSKPPPVPANPLAALSAEARARLPNLVIIGAGKCGTSALHDYLSRHPEVSMSQPKELQLFGGASWLERLGAYAERFDASAPVRGESSPSYSMDPFVPSVPDQMAAVLPEPRFVYLVGDPLRRTVAHWAEQHVLRNDERPMHAALADADDPLNPYVAASRYGHQLARYVDVFGPDRVLVVDQEDLRVRRRQTLRHVFAFVGVDPDVWSPEFERDVNTAQRKLVSNRFGTWVQDPWARRSALARRLSAVPVVSGRRLRRPEIDPETRRRLCAVLAPDIQRFRALTGRAFDHWPV